MAGMRRGDRGASAVEYGLLVAAIAAVLVGVTFVLGGIVRTQFTNISNHIETCSPDPAACPDGTPPPKDPAVP
jgi:pilus assembly protein Flp/PilA